MNLANVKLGDVYRVFVDDEGNLTSYPGMKTMLATVIGINKPRYGSNIILGWKAGTPHPVGCYERLGSPSIENDYIPNQHEYSWGKKVTKSLQVAVQIFNGLDGFPCKKCTNFFPLSEPNQKDGTLVCWSCRNGR